VGNISLATTVTILKIL